MTKARHERFQTRYVTLHIPLFLADTDERKQYDKVVEEYNELRKELFSEAGPERMLHELHDILQAYITLLCVKAKSFSLDEQELFEKVTEVLEQANFEHRKKIERYKVERGWMS